jgi:predicted nucleic acid-binding Zn ribbon protein
MKKSRSEMVSMYAIGILCVVGVVVPLLSIV